jgi:hypothetical protein
MSEKIILALTNKNIVLENTLRDIKRYLEAGAIKTKDDREFCILKIDLALDDEKPIKIK